MIGVKIIIEKIYTRNAYKGTWAKRDITPEEQLHKRRLYDRYKKFIAFNNGYFYLEIPYTSEKDESYKSLIDNKIEEIIKKSA